MSVLLRDRGRLQWHRDSSGQSRRDALGGFASAAGEVAGVQATNGLDLALGVVGRWRVQRRLQRLVLGGGTAQGNRIQLRTRGTCRTDIVALDLRRSQ